MKNFLVCLTVLVLIVLVPMPPVSADDSEFNLHSCSEFSLNFRVLGEKLSFARYVFEADMVCTNTCAPGFDNNNPEVQGDGLLLNMIQIESSNPLCDVVEPYRVRTGFATNELPFYANDTFVIVNVNNVATFFEVVDTDWTIIYLPTIKNEQIERSGE